MQIETEGCVGEKLLGLARELNKLGMPNVGTGEMNETFRGRWK
jgi:hypothetical protein